MLSGCSPKLETIKEKPKIENNPWFEIYENNHNLNPDYLGNLRFESGLFDLEVLKAGDYEEYLRTDWKTLEYDIGGSIFIDPYCDLDSSNISFYGHNYDSGDKMFTPLHILKDEANYLDNRYLNLALKDEVRVYEIAHVFYVEIKNVDGYSYLEDNLYYMHSEYSEIELNNYLNAIKNCEFYETGVKINFGDRFITLQTCVSDHPELRLIVIAKEIENIQLR